MSAGFKDASQHQRQGVVGASRSAHRVSAAQAAAAAKAKARTAATAKATAAQQIAARKAALATLSAPSARMRSYTPEQPSATEAISSVRRGGEQVSRSSQRVAFAGTSDRDSLPSTSRADDEVVTSSRGWVRPMSGGTFTSGFGSRWGRLHAGLDFAVPVGTTLRSMNDGTVVATGWYFGQGKRVVVRFDNGVEAVYAHMSSISVSPGQRVGGGQRLGYSGNTGNSTGPHLHLEIHIGGHAINPRGWLAVRGLM